MIKKLVDVDVKIIIFSSEKRVLLISNSFSTKKKI